MKLQTDVIKFTVVPKVITANGTYNASDEGVDAYNPINVNVPTYEAEVEALRVEVGLCNNRIAELEDELPKQYNAGVQAEYDRFWDAFQFNGGKWDYNRAFTNSCWNAENFKPKYPIHCASCEKMFLKFNHDSRFEPMDLSDLNMTTDKSVNFQFMFWNANVSHIPLIDMTSSNVSAYNTFAWTQTGFESPLHTIDGIKVKKGLTFSKECFYNQKNLVHIIFSGILSTSLWMQDCINLSYQSIESIFSVLSDTPDESNATIALSLEAINREYETSEGKNDGSESANWLYLMDRFPAWNIVLI